MDWIGGWLSHHQQIIANEINLNYCKNQNLKMRFMIMTQSII